MKKQGGENPVGQTNATKQTTYSGKIKPKITETKGSSKKSGKKK